MADDWRTKAACSAEAGDDMFFEPSGYARAKLVCRDCPVRQQCLDYAVRANEQYGVWGGRTPDERRAVRRGMRRRESDIRDAGLDDGTIDAMMAEMRRRGLVL